MIQGMRKDVLSHLLKDLGWDKEQSAPETQSTSLGFAPPPGLSMGRDSNPHTCGFSWKEQAFRRECRLLPHLEETAVDAPGPWSRWQGSREVWFGVFLEGRGFQGLLSK